MMYDCSIEGLELFDAKEEHIPNLLFLIQKIAEYEKMSDEVTASYESLKESIFEKKRAHVILAKYQNEIVGYMLYFYNYSTFTGSANLYLEDIFILKEYRKLGIGKTFFKILAQIACKNHCKRIDWVCLNWNEPSLNFYKSIHAKRLDYWVLHRLEEIDIKNLANS
ncbi:MAG: GNAT family N-acetyltransferase [Anaeroplasmataceae bacterium]|nr:GNAT family N-acetyltransferase [Anaeroplasmataceae bacterium]